MEAIVTNQMNVRKQPKKYINIKITYILELD
jgi:hypothetical protein